MEQQEFQQVGNISYYAFVSTIVEIQASLLPFALAEDIEIDRASDAELDRIKDALRHLTMFGTRFSSFHHYECRLTAMEPSLGAPTYVEQPREEWRYYVVRLKDINKLVIFDCASSISEVPLQASTLYFTSGGGSGWTPAKVWVHLQNRKWKEPHAVTLENLEELNQLYPQVEELYAGTGRLKGYAFLAEAINLLGEVSAMPLSSKFMSLGLFSIIEMLITHNPKSKHRLDSIRRQLKTKLPLLICRFDREVLPGTFFLEFPAKADDLWRELYGYRSDIAHGNKFELTPKKFPESSLAVNNYLYAIVRALIRNGIREPDLYANIKKKLAC